MGAGGQPREEPDIGWLIVQNIERESIGPGAGRDWRKQGGSGRKNHIRRGGEVEQVLDAGNPFIIVLEVNRERLIAPLRAFQVQAARKPRPS